ncbi:peptidoglycan DD-metalloendopeptidase family protein [Conexibacter sp. W3-3-2]|uniref:peptidoglycan-binding protein n=1 Tax=Conexibacter sp. W3-3-2 TaxID=2675227 RepID=UPI0012B9BAA1|nr:peptidoglycan-binding protein [Conexibacter sp. W3-3-2]MTD46659.1 peptidoglycan DD-metalloendopeptidase family protein [Conexibacter sp. W3-3-2]
MRIVGRIRTLLPAAALVACAGALAPSAAVAADLGERPLAPGAQGRDVEQLQAWLERLGLPVGRDGRYGRETELAVRRYEREEGLPEDAVVDREQARQMRRRARPRVRTVTYASRTLRSGLTGTDVRGLQRFLIDHGVKVTPDGDFGPATVKAVRTLERRAKLRADGRVTRSEARRIRTLAPAPTPTGAAAPTVDPQPVAATVAPGSRVFPIRGSWKFGDEGTFYGDRGGAHKGVDVFASCGVPMAAAEGGKVVFKATDGRAGNYVVIRGAESGEDHAYMHLQRAVTQDKGDTIATGEVFGAVGRTGNATACHLHFEIWTAPGWYTGGASRDPLPDLKAWARADR